MAAMFREQVKEEFKDIHHYELTWIIKNVYMCRTLLEGEIPGPDYGENIFRFQFKLTLAQSTDSSGVALFIHSAYVPTELVSFHVYVYVSGKKCLLDGTYQTEFGFGHHWESPVLITNEEFKEATVNDCREYWEIQVQLIWHEPVEYEKVKEKHKLLSKFLRKRDVGKDLKRFVKKELFSDIIINSKEAEILAHKAILYARCSHLAKKIDSLVSNNTESDNYELILPEEPDVINTFLKYLYTGDTACITEDNPLPIGIYKCACSMKMNHLEWLTAPFRFYGKTSVQLETVKYEWVLRHSEIMVNIDEPITIDTEPFGNRNKDVFSLSITITPATYHENSSPTISVTLNLDALKDRESIYAIVEISVKAKAESEVLFRKKVADNLTSVSNKMRFPEFLCKEKIREIAYWGINDLYFDMKIIYSRDEMQTITDRMPTGFEVDLKHAGLYRKPEYDFYKTYLGWMSLTSDLSRLLMHEKFSDCTIVVEDERLPAHRIILAARSPYFSNVFEKAEQECKGSSNGMEIFVGKDLSKITPDLMKIALEEIYTGYADFGTESTNNIYVLAKFFGLSYLKEEAYDKIGLYRYLYYGLKTT